MQDQFNNDPVHDASRLRAIGQLDLVSPEMEVQLAGYAAAAARYCNLPIGLVSIVLDSAQYIAGMYGLEGWMAESRGTPVEWSFCAHVVRRGSPYVVEDAANDELQADNPLVVVDGVRCYAGAPLRLPGDVVIGALCVVGGEPHLFDRPEIDELGRLADQVVRDLLRPPHDVSVGSLPV